MKMLVVEAYQPQASYKNPYTYFFAQTFPLPPPSTIRGLLGRITGKYYHSFEDVKIAVAGKYGSRGWEYTQMLKVEEAMPVPGDIWIVTDTGGGKKDRGFLFNKEKRVRRTPVKRELLLDVHLYLFFKGEEKDMREVREAFERPKHSMYLGRADDILFVKDIKEYSYAGEEDPEEGIITLPKEDLYMYVRFTEELKDIPTYYIPERIEFNTDVSVTGRGVIALLRPAQKVHYTTVYYVDAKTMNNVISSEALEVWKSGEEVIVLPEEVWF